MTGIALVSESLALLGRRGVVFRPLDSELLQLPLMPLLPPQPTPAAVALAEMLKA